MKAMLLCAGMGVRLQPYTLTKPKPLVPFLGVPMVEYSLALLEDVKVDSYVVNLHHLPDQIQNYFQSKALRLDFSDERSELLGSGGGIRNARPLLEGEDFFVLNADEIILPHAPGVLEEMLKFHQWHGGLGTLLTTQHPEVGSKFGGAWCDSESQVKIFSKSRPADHALKGHHFIGVMLFRKDLFEFFLKSSGDENIFYETLTSAISKGEKVFCFDCACEWLETGNPNDFFNGSENLLRKLESPSPEDSTSWRSHLASVFGRVEKPEFLIESDRPDLIQRIKAAHARAAD